MKASTALPLFATLLFAAVPVYAQQNPSAIACGAGPSNFSVKSVNPPPLPSQPPAGKALVYVVESMPDAGLLTKKVNVGLDGNWLGATDRNTYISFTVDPGVHHLCAAYQGEADPMQQGDQTILLHLDAKAGKTYFLHYHAFFLKEAYGVAYFDKVDEDEGLYLVQSSSLAVSKLSK